jgi:hypothetical protein
MIRAGIAVAVLLAGVFAWETAPALSGTWHPAPVDFELHASSVPAVAAAQAPVTTVRPAKRFNVVGMRWRGGGPVTLRMRVHDAAHGWRGWVRVGAEGDHSPDRRSAEGGPRGWHFSDPVWTGNADALQYRVAGQVRTPVLHFVNTEGTATGADRIRTGLRSVVAGAIDVAGSVLGGGRAEAAGEAPAIVPRAAWGAGACPPRAAPAYGRVQVAFVHHTVTANDYGPEDSAAMVLGICRYHRNSNGWNDIGYNFLVDRYGKVFEGRAGGIDQPVVGAQAQGYNNDSTGVASLGTFNIEGQTAAGLDAIARLLAWKLGVHGVPATGTVGIVTGGGPLNRYPAGRTVTLQRISGHRDGDATSCPGNGLYAQLPDLRRMVAGLPRPSVTSLSLSAERRHIRFGDKAVLSGKLSAPDASPLAARPVAVQIISATGRWSTLQTVNTDGAGNFQTRVRLAYNHSLRARFAGEPAAGATASPALGIGVRPAVTATASSTPDDGMQAGDKVSIRGSVSPHKRVVLLLAERRSRGVYRRVLRRPMRISGGRVKTGFRFGRNGIYRLRLAVLADRRSLSARSEAIGFSVKPAAGG